MIQIRPITQETAGDLLLKNESFSMPGRMIPRLQDGVWDYDIQWFPGVHTMTFPEETYDFASLSKRGVLLGAYWDGKCVGLAILQDAMFQHMYLYDLKVSARARGKGVGKRLIEAAMEHAKKRGYQGIYTQAQDNNLNACLFYLKVGFTIGGFDNHVYRGTPQAHKADIFFYMAQEE